MEKSNLKKKMFISVIIFIFINVSKDLSYSKRGPENLRPHCPTQSGGELIQHTYYELCYSEFWEQSQWVYYQLEKKEIENPTKTPRSNDFRKDPKVSTGSSDPMDYHGSNYDKGHLAPARDMGFDPQAMSESFYMSNISPQDLNLNRKIWLALEDFTRKMAVEKQSVLVYVGPILIHLPKSWIGVKNNIGVPNYFWKMIVIPDTMECIGFVIPNNKHASLYPLGLYRVDCNFINFVNQLGLPELKIFKENY